METNRFLLDALSGGIGELFGPWSLLRSKQKADPLAEQIMQMSEQEAAYWKANVLPIQEKLLGVATDPRLAGENAQQARESVDARFAALPDEIKRQFSAQGIRPNEMQQNAIDRSVKLNRGISEVSAMNAARQQTAQMQKGLLGI